MGKGLRPWACLLTLAAGLLSLSVVRVAVQTTDDFFRGQTLRRIDLYLNSRDWQDLRSDTPPRTYRPATLKWGETVVRNVGIRSEGGSGRPPLVVDTSWYVQGETFLGLPSLTLDNLAADASAVRRTVTLKFLQWMDLPAPRAAHVLLYVNNAPAGVYAAVEPIDHAVAEYARVRGQEAGRLYRYVFPAPWPFGYPGTDPRAYEALFQPQSGERSFDDYAAIEAMVRAVNTDSSSTSEQQLARYIDSELFVRSAAVQNFLGLSAGLLGSGGMSGFSLNVREPRGAVQIIPDGSQMGLTDPSRPIDQGLDGNVLTRSRIRLSPTAAEREPDAVRVMSRRYLDALLASADMAERRDGPVGSAPRLQAEIARQRRLIAGAIELDSVRAWTNRDVDAALATIDRFARDRAASVRCQIAALGDPSLACAGQRARVNDASRHTAAAPPHQSATPSLTATNLARGRTYTLAPRPNYTLTTDAGDDTQLTDGAYTAGTLWTRASSVGWTRAVPVTVVIDLGTVQPISGVSFSTAAGTSNVFWPRSIFVLVSDDGQRFFAASDLAAPRDGAEEPPQAGYAAHRFETTDLRTHGRYVAIVVDPTGSYTFCDEIEVLSGDPAWLRSPLTGESTTDLQRFFRDARTGVAIRRRLAADLAAVRAALDRAPLDPGMRTRLALELSAAQVDVAAIPAPAAASFRAVLPLNAAHARIFATNGRIAEARGRPPLSAWVVNPWSFVRPMDEPPAPADAIGTLSIAAMNGETRSGAINVSNATSRPMTVTIHADVSTGSDLEMYETLWTDTFQLTPVADALIPLPGGASFELPAGMTRQLWVSFAPSNREPGISRGHIEATGADGRRVTVPLELRVLAGSFPARPRLHLGGWDYTDQDHTYGLTSGNRDALIRQLQQLKVDSPWAGAGALGPGTYDAAGRLQGSPDTSVFDAWIARWPEAARYMVFVNARDTLGSIPVGDARFRMAAADWIRFWTAHAASLGIEPSRLMLLLVDEPRSPSQDERVVAWATAIKAAEPRIRIWEDPTYPDPTQASPQLLGASDVLALKRSLMLEHGQRFVDFYRERLARGQGLDIYGSFGGSRLLDPYTYYRLQAWLCADVGAGGSFFWSFIDDGDGSSWNEYAGTRAVYSPFFLSPDEVTITKHSEAIREGVEDFEYLAMLRDRVAGLTRTDPNRPGLAEAIALLENAVASVVTAPGATDLDWATDKDRAAAERVRLMIADALERLR